MATYLIKNSTIVNEGKSVVGDILIKDGRIKQIGTNLRTNFKATEIDGTGKILMPGIIDDQVHFREPGLTHKATIGSESRAAVAGGITSFMEMPNTKPPAVTQELLQDKYDIASKTSAANYSFFMGASNDNLEEVLKTDHKNVCGIKIFMGSSTGNMLVDEIKTLEGLFSRVDMLMATHCEDEETISRNEAEYRLKFGEHVPIKFHPYIRNVEGCHKSSSMAVKLARDFDARLHILHISTADELHLFENDLPLEDKRITAEVCVHHLWFDGDDYARLGTKIKCNPAIKAPHHKAALFEALLDDRLDIIATDHAPHTLDEKQQTYFKAPSGLPLVQHALNVMLAFQQQGKISMERIVEKMCHAPATCFNVKERGYIREGYFADLAIINPQQEWAVSENNIYYKCGWSPFEDYTFKGKVEKTFVNGDLVYDNGHFDDGVRGRRLEFF